jgi:glycosidase
VWTTFSEDQIDLNWQNPDVLFEFLDILFLYLSKGCRIFRLDAVPSSGNRSGQTACITLKRMRL